VLEKLELLLQSCIVCPFQQSITILFILTDHNFVATSLNTTSFNVKLTFIGATKDGLFLKDILESLNFAFLTIAEAFTTCVFNGS
jgi:hypothetical protein